MWLSCLTKTLNVPYLTLASPTIELDRGIEVYKDFDIYDGPHVLNDQDLIYDTSSMCAVAMNTPKGNIFLDSESPTQMFLIGGFDGENFKQWYVQTLDSRVYKYGTVWGNHVWKITETPEPGGYLTFHRVPIRSWGFHGFQYLTKHSLRTVI